MEVMESVSLEVVKERLLSKVKALTVIVELTYVIL